VFEVHNQHQTAAYNVVPAQVRLCRLLDQRSTPADLKPGDQMYLDASSQHSQSHQVPYKLANRWMGPYVVLDVSRPSVHLDLPTELDKISLWVNVCQLKFFEQHDAEFTDLETLCVPSVAVMEHSVTRFTVFGGTNHTASCLRGVSGPVERL
jgi:hypothetical protein